MPATPTEPVRQAPGLILLDLDGTLADTAPDLAHALNRALQAYGRPALPFEQIRPVVSLGATAMIGLGFDMAETDPGFAERRQRLLDFYQEDVAVHTRLFPGMDRVLQRITQSGRRWGIVTNKPGWLTRPLLQALAPPGSACCIVSGDSLPQRKPHPAPLLHACELSGSSPAEALYIGDARGDVVAGHAAGMRVIVARYGYIPVHEDPASWGAEACIDAPLDLLAWLD